jgi:hypothetical protein
METKERRDGEDSRGGALRKKTIGEHRALGSSLLTCALASSGKMYLLHSGIRKLKSNFDYYFLEKISTFTMSNGSHYTHHDIRFPISFLHRFFYSLG